MKPSSQKFRSLDVRPLLARGEEPFPKIMATVNSLQPDEGFVLIAPFLPSPLIERLHAAGYQARPERAADGGWKTFFWRD
ncbi:DUF2249 domain-containing protein [Opitutus terrae]|uniref:DUF2249 domain-containing protein n=1 Tax=Opitutus terrae (strain DSM 11246 / JCM 15787 / PB90-1) TaxID=452637 RepID=B1ZWR6_OPITP|nr:DUF2249 domain-containing protein [Opitutus terrae]ACB74193.1 conserved hypothetical protein [Opitutus terrae PB90-1]